MENIQELLVLYYEINNIYKELYKLEVSFKRDSVEFLELVELLKERIEQENGLFNRFYNEFNYDYSYEVMDDGTPVTKRLIDYMNFYEALDVPFYEGDNIEDVMKEKIDDMKYAKLYKSCSRNVFLVYLSFLQESVDLAISSSLREKILSFKYYNAFINHDVEGCLIDSNFEVASVNYVNLYFCAETLGLDINMCDSIILDCYKDTVEVTINQLLSLSDMDYNDENNKAMSINNQSMLRAALSLMSKTDYEKNKVWIFGLINSLVSEKNHISLNIINSIINGMNKDKGRVRKISLRILEL